MPTTIHLIDGEVYNVSENFDNIWRQIADDEMVHVHIEGQKEGVLGIPSIFIESFEEYL